MKEHSRHDDLCGSDRWSIIPYIHGRMRVVLQCVIQGLTLNGLKITFLVLVFVRAFYS
jgi:hypothetical protein